jgi:hypothetical protein
MKFSAIRILPCFGIEKLQFQCQFNSRLKLCDYQNIIVFYDTVLVKILIVTIYQGGGGGGDIVT